MCERGKGEVVVGRVSEQVVSVGDIVRRRTERVADAR
jgi:hypothetical protein